MVRRRRSEFWISGNDIDDEGRWEWAKTGHQQVCTQLSWFFACLPRDGIELFLRSLSGWLCLSTSRLVPGVGLRSPTTPLRRTAWRGVCLPPPPSPPPRSGTGPPAAITCSTSASLSDLYLIINLMALETICIEKSIYVFQFKLSCIIQPVRKWCFLNGLNDHNQVWKEDRPWETVAVDIWRNTSQKLPCSPGT